MTSKAAKITVPSAAFLLLCAGAPNPASGGEIIILAPPGAGAETDTVPEARLGAKRARDYSTRKGERKDDDTVIYYDTPPEGGFNAGDHTDNATRARLNSLKARANSGKDGVDTGEETVIIDTRTGPGDFNKGDHPSNAFQARINAARARKAEDANAPDDATYVRSDADRKGAFNAGAHPDNADNAKRNALRARRKTGLDERAAARKDCPAAVTVIGGVSGEGDSGATVVIIEKDLKSFSSCFK